MAHFPKPAEGSWTEHYSELGTGPVSYEDSISPEHYELEREAIFQRTWLNVGRVEQLPRTGSYFTKELDAARHVGHRRARHATARSAPSTTSAATAATSSCGTTTRARRPSGTCRQFTCKYHGWRYDLEGDAHLRPAGVGVLRPRQGRLRPGAGAVRGVGGVHLREPRPRRTPRRCASTWASSAPGIEGYPFDEMTQVHKYRAEVGSNWKLFIDAFAEFYHAPVLHAKQAVGRGVAQAPGLRLRGAGLRHRRPARHGVVVGRHGAAEGRRAWSSRSSGCCAAACSVRGTRPTSASTSCPTASTRPATRRGAMDSFVFFPNFMLLMWKPNWYLTYHYWPTSYNTPHLRGHALLRARRRTPTSGSQQELAAVTFKEYAPAGRQHPRGHADDDRVAGRDRVPALRPGGPAPPPPQDRARLRRRPPAGAQVRARRSTISAAS